MSRGPSVTKEEYEFIKLLISKKIPNEDICARVKRGIDTVRCVAYSSDYDDFYKTPTKVLRRRGRKEKQVQLSVSDLCPQEDVACQCDEHNDQKKIIQIEQHTDLPDSELSAKDKKELAMYAIDQLLHYFKQLTGVI